jgi:hypothetical protein
VPGGGKAQRKRFFSEEKNQKTFIRWWLALPAWVACTRRAALKKVFFTLAA